jgi:hypothetical protein
MIVKRIKMKYPSKQLMAIAASIAAGALIKVLFTSDKKQEKNRNWGKMLNKKCSKEKLEMVRDKLEMHKLRLEKHLQKINSRLAEVET